MRQKTDIDKIKERLELGEAIEGDLSWCEQRIKVLESWYEPLNYIQQQEMMKLKRWLDAA